MRFERLRVLAVCILATVTVACGGSDGGSGSSQTSPPPPPATNPLTGVFLDSPVQGLGYSTTPSGLSGITNADGQFNYNQGDTVTFDLYGRTIGTPVPAAPVVTVLSVFNATRLTDPRVVNLSQLLLTLGGNPTGSNSIILPATPPANFPSSIDFSDPGFDTMFPGLTLISEPEATEHLGVHLSLLSVKIAGANSGNVRVTSSPTNIDCPAVCTAAYPTGSSVTLSALGGGFTGWSGGGSGLCVYEINGIWSQHAYIKASNTGERDSFGRSMSISGNTLAIGANGEASSATGVNGNQADTSVPSRGAAYVFVAQ